MNVSISGSSGRNPEEEWNKLCLALQEADAVLVGSGAGLSTAAGLTYTGERLNLWFGDFLRKYPIPDMYTGGFFALRLPPEICWAYWARYIYINRYLDPPKPVYSDLLRILSGKDYFSLTTNVDHCFQKAGFDKNRLFYMQGDYGLFQTVDGRNGKTYDNEAWVMQAMAAQGFQKDETGILRVPEDGSLRMELPTELIPTCPDDGSAVTMNLRADASFVEDAGWHAANARYEEFLRTHETGRVLYLELGVGANTPVIIKYPFWQRTLQNPDSTYACLNYGEAFAPDPIRDRSIFLDADIAEVLANL